MMPSKNNKKICISKKAAGIYGLVGVVLVILIVSAAADPTIFQGMIDRETDLNVSGSCNGLNIKSIPSPLKANTDAVIIVETDPPDFEGTFTASASSGSLGDAAGNFGSYINTPEKVLSYSGGESNSRLTIQASGAGNEGCADSLVIESGEKVNCESIQVDTNPSPLTANESAELKITVTPETFDGYFIINADSGKLQLPQADPEAHGINTGTLITTLKEIIYTGGKDGEQILVKALGEGNGNCEQKVSIGL